MPCLYIFIPLLVYAGEMGAAGWIPSMRVWLHNLAYLALAFFAVMTLKFTKRTGGFRITPMDFIVVVLALAVTALPREILPEEAVKSVIPKILALFFGYEVLGRRTSRRCAGAYGGDGSGVGGCGVRGFM